MDNEKIKEALFEIKVDIDINYSSKIFNKEEQELKF
jgi:hypothetical protein